MSHGGSVNGGVVAFSLSQPLTGRQLLSSGRVKMEKKDHLGKVPGGWNQLQQWLR